MSRQQGVRGRRFAQDHTIKKLVRIHLQNFEKILPLLLGLQKVVVDRRRFSQILKEFGEFQRARGRVGMTTRPPGRREMFPQA